MIYPSIYSFNAPFRGTKDSKEVDKLFTSIRHDISTVYTELEKAGAILPNSLRFYTNANIAPPLKTDTTITIDNVVYSHSGTNKICQKINDMQTRISQILNNL